MKYLVVGLSLINGLWMLIDGIHVMPVGKYLPFGTLISITVIVALLFIAQD